MTDEIKVKTLEPQALDLELRGSREPFLVAFLKKNERFRNQSRALGDASSKHRERVHCFLYDADYLDTAMERFRVKGTPTFVLFDEGREVGRLMGESDGETLDDFIRNAISDDK